jgi:flagellin-like protein
MGNIDSRFIFVKYLDFKVSGHRRITIMRNMLKSKKGISPILATLLLIVIAVAAVIVTYAWVMTFTGTTTGQAGAVLTVENVRFYDDGHSIDITVRNSGTADATVDAVYGGNSSSNLEQAQDEMLKFEPNSQIVEAGSTLTITAFNDPKEAPLWKEGETYYITIATEEGISIPFSREA